MVRHIIREVISSLICGLAGGVIVGTGMLISAANAG